MFNSFDEAQKIVHDSLKSSFEQYDKIVLSKVPNLPEDAKEFVKQVFEDGYYAGVSYFSTYFTQAILKDYMSHTLDSALKEETNSLSKSSPETQPHDTQEDIIQNLLKQLNVTPPSNN